MIISNGNWVLAPAYDLLNVAIVLPEDKDELALTLDGKRRKFKKEHFEQFGKGLGLTDRQISNVFKRFVKEQDKANQWLEKSFLSCEMITAYKTLMKERIDNLF